MHFAQGFVPSCRSLSRENPTMISTPTITTPKGRSLCLGCLLLMALLTAPVAAQEWADKMFNKQDHDFGTVARGAETIYRFEITNIYKQPMQITGVRSSCGCTTPTIENPTIKTHEKAFIVAKFNTHTFVGRHGATLTVSLAPPYQAEVQVRVHGNIRSDVVFQPGSIQFGTVDQGTSKEQRISVNYAGRSDWRILDVTNDNNHFEVELQETSRGGGRVSYSLLVRLKDNLPASYVKDQLTVVTNDGRPETQRIPLFVEGRVVPEISVTPAALVLGDVLPGEPITKKLIVRGKSPFRITSVDCGDDCFEFKTDQESKTLHFVELTYRPDNRPGAMKVPVQISTDRGPNRGATFMVSATVREIKPTTDTQADSDPQTSNLVENASAASTTSK